MDNLIIIPHSSVSSDYLIEIIKIKSNAWPYSYEDQIKWISANLKKDDLHVLLEIENDFVAYLNLIYIELHINKTFYQGYGVGNVCAKNKGKGWGKELISQTNTLIKNENKVGLLFCKNSLMKFYSNLNWEILESKYIITNFNIDNIISMTYNYSEPINLLDYKGQIF